MLATFLRVNGERGSIPPRLRFRIRVQGEEKDNFTIVELLGKVTLWASEKRFELGIFHPTLTNFAVHERAKRNFDFYLDFDEYKRKAVETERNDGNVDFKILLVYQFFRLGKIANGRERIKTIGSNELWVCTAEGSDTITIEQSRWNKVLGELGYRKRLLFELPIDFEEILSSTPRHPREGLARRIDIASKSFQKALTKLRIGKWRDAVVESRKVYEALKKGKLENGKRVRDAIEEMLVEYGLPKQNKANLTQIIRNFWAYTSPTHHILDDEGNIIKEDEPTIFGREDAYLTVTTAGLLIKMLTEKLQ